MRWYEGKTLLVTKVVPVDWNGGGDFCGNSTSGSTRTERSEGEGWSRARETRPPQWKSTASKKKRVQERIFVPVLSLFCLEDFFSALSIARVFFVMKINVIIVIRLVVVGSLALRL